MGREAPHDFMPFFITVGDPTPTVPHYDGDLNPPNPVVPDGTVVSTSPSTILLYGATPITEIGFVDLTDKGAVPENTSTWFLLALAGIALYGGKRFGVLENC